MLDGSSAVAAVVLDGSTVVAVVMLDGSSVVAAVVLDGSSFVAVVELDGSSVVAAVVLDGVVELVVSLVAAVSLEVELFSDVVLTELSESVEFNPNKLFLGFDITT